MQPYLFQIDNAISVVALITLLVVGMTWGRAQVDPLRLAPHRANDIREDSLGLAILIYLCIGLLAGLFVKSWIGETDTIHARTIASTIVQVGGVGVCLVVATFRVRGGISRFIFGPVGRGRFGTLRLTFVCTLLAVGLCPMVRDVTVWILQYVAPDYSFPTHQTIKGLHDGSQSMATIVTLWLGAALLAPVAEEMFFRGLLQTFLVRLSGRRWFAIGVASLAFGGVHVEQAYAVPALAVLGVIMGFAYERTGSLVPPIAIHALFNLKTLLWDAAGAA